MIRLWKQAYKIRWRLNCIVWHGILFLAEKRPWAYYYMGSSLWSNVYNALWWALDPLVFLWLAHHAWMGVTVTALLVAWVWHPTSSGNGDVLICINAPFLTQRVLKPWCPWTYQNSIVKRASMKVVPGWVIFCEVWFGGAKSGQYCVIGGGSL
jgi:hypothetical protein